MVEMQQGNGPDVPNKEQAHKAICLLDVHVLYNGEMLELSGGVPVQAVDLEKLLKGDLTGGSSFRLPLL